MRESPWYKIIGEDLLKAFQFAHEADPKAELYYNDYSLENEAKRKGAVRDINGLKELDDFVSFVRYYDPSITSELSPPVRA